MPPAPGRLLPLLLVGACALPAEVPDAADEVDEAEEADGGDTLTGDWGGLRPWLEEQGLQLELSATSDIADVLSGGVRQRSTTQVLWDVALTADLDRLFGWPETSAYVEWWSRPGRLLNDDVGDWQGTSNIDTPHRHELYELWLEVLPVPDLLRVKLGKLDAFDDFAVVEAGAEFLNNGMAYSPTLSPMPSYPDSAYGGLLFAYPAEGTWVGAGVFDGAAQEGVSTGTHGASTLFGEPSDLFVVGEVGHSWSSDGELAPGRAALGLWRHTGDFVEFEGGEQDGATGAYAILEQELWAARPEEPDASGALTGFVELAFADEKVIEVARHMAAGLQWVGPWAGRDDDVLGLGATRVDFSDEPGAGFTRDHELALETFYRWQATPWLAIKPDLQYVLDPGGTDEPDDALVLTVRLEATF